VVAILLVNIHVANGPPFHGNDVSFQHPRRANLHPQLGGKPLGGSPNKGSLRRRSSPDPLVGFDGWPTFDSKMFMPPWYPSVAI